MATVTNIILTDDFTGETGAETICFTVNGQEMEVEMTSETFEKMFGAIISRARVIKKNSSKEIRAWLVENKIPHHPRGRLSHKHIEMFNKANA